MEVFKNCTDLEQSKKLIEFLPLESADMHYLTYSMYEEYCDEIVYTINLGKPGMYDKCCIPCWSLAALFDVLPKYIGDYGKCLYFDMGYYYCGYIVDGDFMLSIEETSAGNPIDACVEMIVKLHEQNLL